MSATVPKCVILQTVFEYVSRIRYGMSVSKFDTNNLDVIYNKFSCDTVICKKEDTPCINYTEQKISGIE